MYLRRHLTKMAPNLSEGRLRRKKMLTKKYSGVLVVAPEILRGGEKQRFMKFALRL